MNNYNLYQPNCFPISTPVFQNSNNHISFNHTSIHYYHNNSNGFNEAPQTSYPPLLKPANSLVKSKSADNLHNNECKIQIGNQIKLSKNDISKNIKINQDNIDKTLIKPIEINEIPLEIKKTIDSSIQNKLTGFSFSDGFLVKKNIIVPKEEDVLSDELQKKVIKSPIRIRINMKNLNQTLMSLESKKQHLDQMKSQNKQLKTELKKNLEKKIRMQAVETLLIENMALNSLLTSKLHENARLIKNISLTEELELNNPELKKLKEQNQTFVKILQVFQTIDEKKKELSKLKEEIQIKEMTYHIGFLKKNGGNMKRIGELMQILPSKIEELFGLIKLEFKKKERICVN